MTIKGMVLIASMRRLGLTKKLDNLGVDRTDPSWAVVCVLTDHNKKVFCETQTTALER
jgi:hypothetical protein